MQIDIISKEYPPHIYGGAGVHVFELSKALKAIDGVDINIRCFDGPRDEKDVFGYEKQNPNLSGVFETLDIDNQIASDIKDTDLVHSHTWYANMAGFLASKNLNVPHIITAHSLEPLRPWKAEQLGGGYAISSFIEKNAYEAADGIIAVSNAMRNDILKAYPNVDPKKVYTVLNGIDIDVYKKAEESVYKKTIAELKEKYGIADAPTATFVGRITRQKGLVYLMEALEKVPSNIQIILCAGAPDTPEIMQEVDNLYKELLENRGNIVLITDMLPVEKLKCLLQFSDCFLCPSIYEPLGIVNLEAMALDLPVVATRTGGIPEVVQHGETGILVDIEQHDDGTGKPIHPEKFVNDLSNAITQMFSDLDKAKVMGLAGRKRVEENFTWEKIAAQTLEVYKSVLASK
jgi:starch synthase